MRNLTTTSIAWLATCVAILSIGCTNEPTSRSIDQPTENSANQTSEVYTATDFDPAAKPAKDLQRTIRIASQKNKRILLDVGGNWCSWCKLMDQFIHDNSAVHQLLKNHFVVIKVNYSEENKNTDFLSQYPEIPGYPHLFVLDSDGTFLHSQGTAELEEGRGYSEKKFTTFLKAWIDN